MGEQRAVAAGSEFDGRGPVGGPSFARVFLGQYSVAILCGAGLALAFPTYHLYPLAWIVLAPLIRRGLTLAPRAVGVQFLVAGFVFHLVLLQWLMSNVYWAGGWAWWGYVALSFILAAFWFATGAVWRYSNINFKYVPAEVSLPVMWGAMEYVMSFAFTGFGWSAIAYSQASDLWVAQWAAVGGVPLVSAFVVACNVLLAKAWVDKRRRIARCAGAAALVVVPHAVGAMMMGTPDYEGRPMKAALVQADFPLEMKWDPEYAVDMVRNAAEKSRMLIHDEKVDLIVWPEALIMVDIETPGVIDEVSTLARDADAYVFAGAHRTNPRSDGSMNSSYLVDPDGVVKDYYDKIHLAPFGEYVPLSTYLPLIGKIVPAIGDIEHGTSVKTFQTRERRLGPLICFEVIFPWMAERLRDEGADYLVVVTNLGWFGTSNAIGQELEIARMRAIETRLPLVHCANTGITGVFDPWGRFSIIDVYFRDATTAYKVNASNRYQTVMARVGGVLPVAAPAVRPWNDGPRTIPNAFLVLGIGVALLSSLWAFIAARRGKRPDTP